MKKNSDLNVLKNYLSKSLGMNALAVNFFCSYYSVKYFYLGEYILWKNRKCCNIFYKFSENDE